MTIRKHKLSFEDPAIELSRKNSYKYAIKHIRKLIQAGQMTTEARERAERTLAHIEKGEPFQFLIEKKR